MFLVVRGSYESSREKHVCGIVDGSVVLFPVSMNRPVKNVDRVNIGGLRTKFYRTLFMFGIRLAVKYTVECGMSPWIVHQSYQGSAPGCSGVLHQVRRAPL